MTLLIQKHLNLTKFSYAGLLLVSLALILAAACPAPILFADLLIVSKTEDVLLTKFEGVCWYSYYCLITYSFLVIWECGILGCDNE